MANSIQEYFRAWFRAERALTDTLPSMLVGYHATESIEVHKQCAEADMSAGIEIVV